MSRHTIAVLRGLSSSLVELVLKTGTPDQIQQMWGVLKVAEEEAKRPVGTAREEMQ